MNEAEEIIRLNDELEFYKRKLRESLIKIRKLKATLKGVSNFLNKAMKED